MSYSGIGALANALRGGQYDTKNGKWINAIVFGVCAFFSTGDYLIILPAILAMRLGASFGWGDYIGALIGERKDNLHEVGFIDFFLKALLAKPVLWGFAGLTLRGALWGLILAVPFFVLGHSWMLFPILGSLMGVVFWINHKFQSDDNRMWQNSEWVFGAVLWGAL